MYECWRCKGETPNRVQDILYRLNPIKYEKYKDNYSSLCDKCDEELNVEHEFENEQTNDYITCPACGFEFDCYDCTNYYESEGEEVECEVCNAKYEVTAVHTVEFTTKRIK